MNKEELIGKLQMVYVGDTNALNELIGYYDGLKQGSEELQQENQKYKEVIEKAIEWVRDWTHGKNDWFEEDSKPSELLDILKEVE